MNKDILLADTEKDTIRLWMVADDVIANDPEAGIMIELPMDPSVLAGILADEADTEGVRPGDLHIYRQYSTGRFKRDLWWRDVEYDDEVDEANTFCAAVNAHPELDLYHAFQYFDFHEIYDWEGQLNVFLQEKDLPEDPEKDADIDTGLYSMADVKAKLFESA